MKKYILMALSVCALTACDLANGEGAGSGNAVYMGNANSSGVVSMVVSDAKGGSTFVTPRLANLTEEPVEVTVALDKEALAAYNQSAGLAMEAVDAEDFILVANGKEYKGSAKAEVSLQGTTLGVLETEGSYKVKGQVTMPKDTVPMEEMGMPNLEVLINRLKAAGLSDQLLDQLGQMLLFGMLG